MTTPTAPMTKLDAVNQMLASIGQTPVNSLATSNIRDVQTAELALDTELRNVLLLGLQFNTDTEYELTPNSNDRIVVPNTAFFVDPCYDYKNYVMRWNDNEGGLCLYDKDERTFTITEDKVLVDVVWGFEFEEVPQHVRNYVSTKAARVWQSQVIGSDILFKFTELHEKEAKATMLRLELRGEDTNMLRSAADTNRIFTRHRNARRF